MQTLNIDLETFSSVDIKKAGLYKYVQSPDFEILLFAYSVNGQPAQIVDLAMGEQIPQEVIFALGSPLVTNYAFNAAFEWYCLSKHFSWDPLAWLNQWRDTQFHSLYCGFTTGLDVTGKVLGLPSDKRKLTAGKALIKLFCTPTKPTKKNGERTRTFPHHEPEKWQLFKEYCIGDVEAEKEVGRKLSNFPIPAAEQRLWELDQRINVRGVAVDQQLIEGALHINELSTAALTIEAHNITKLSNPNSGQQLTKWLSEKGVETENLQKETVSNLIKTTTDNDVKRALEIRQELSKTSVKKYQAMVCAVCEDGRVRGLLQFYGANRTGRWAGRLVQVQNLPRNYLETLWHARELVRLKKAEALKVIYGNVPDTLSQLIRTAFIATDKWILAISDFSAIEARVIAWLSGEQWRLDVFATHGKIYEASASQMFGVPLELIKKGNPEYELRQRGKVAELALGYQGAGGALAQMDKDGAIDPADYPDIVRRWRSANKRIVDLWFSLENAALSVMRNGQPVGVKGLIIARESDIQNGLDFLTVTLPSGRKLFYVKPFLAENDFGKEALHYYGMNQETKKWEKISTYGGKMTENIVQAIARDCLAEALIRLDNAGYPIVMHIHDEIVAEIATGRGSLEEMERIMGEPVPWAPGLPLGSDGFVTEYYKKD
ncbi:DNA polymerase [Bacillus sp. CGMCC 1.16607]|uniref:DNA polymerase n=1 Tax=Bacillus sp. CGMCC 1.16607 TaxID=3351842 RepID=UPI003639B7DE